MITDVSHILNTFSDSGYDKNLRPNYGGKSLLSSIFSQTPILILIPNL